MGRKNKLIQIEQAQIEGMATDGKAVARHNGVVVFVTGAVPGDVADLRVTRKKKSFYEATATHIHEYSPRRTEPFCQHFGTCGGCKWQHMLYGEQLHFKQQQVQDNLERLAKVALPPIQPILPSPQQTYYRNKLEYTFSNKRWLTTEEIASGQEFQRDALGFHVPGSFDKVVAIEKCWLQNDLSNRIRLLIRDYALANQLKFYDFREHTGHLRTLVVRTTTGQAMVIVQFGYANQEEVNGLMAHMQQHIPEVTSLNYIINHKKNETFHDLEVHCVYGKPYITEQMETEPGGRKLQYRIGPKSFYQTNSNQAEAMYRKVRAYAQIGPDDVVYDLYTGTGTIANFVAADAAKVVGLEYVHEAIEDAKVNSAINEVGNTSFFAGDIKDLLTDEFLSANGRPDVIITDPPRAGMHADVVGMLLKTGAKRIVYVSCNPATQARDLALLNAAYTVTAVQPIDMFPHTHHVENIVLLALKK